MLTFSGPPSIGDGSWCDSDDLDTHAEVLMAGSNVSAGQGDHSRRPALELTVRGAGTSSRGLVADALEAAVEGLHMPINISADPAVATAKLEATS